MTSINSPVWFITGCTSGFGKEIARHVLDRGWRAVVTARDPSRLHDFIAPYGKNALALRLDLNEPASIREAVQETQHHFGHIDVLVNNAGYGYLSAIEEGEDSAIRQLFETNVFGLNTLTKLVLPGMRQNRRGHIFNFSSLGGLVAFPATGYYHATKYAVEALSESLSMEVSPLGIKVTIIEPGAFRTNWAGSSMIESQTVIDDYAETAGKRRMATKSVSGNQPGSPALAAKAILSCHEMENPPLRLLLGAGALSVAIKRMDTLKEEFEKWSEITVSADFPAKE